jgi:hypothetical protein
MAKEELRQFALREWPSSMPMPEAGWAFPA